MGGAVGAVGTAQVFEIGEELATDDLLHACVATVTVAGQAPELDQSRRYVRRAPRCSAHRSRRRSNSPGWVDNESLGFSNLVQASLESPKTERWLLIDYGTEGGYIFGPVEIGEMTITAGVNAGLAYSGSGMFTEMPTYSWAL